MWIVVNLIIYLLLVLLAWGLGVRLSRWLGIIYDSVLECFAFAVGLGFASLIAVGFALATVGWLTAAGIDVSLAVLAVIGLPALRGVRQIVVVTKPVVGQPTLRRLQWLVWLFIGALAVLHVIGALAPDTIWDANSYHLEVAKQWLSTGSFTYLPYNVYGDWPLNLSVLYAIEMNLLAGSTLPQLTHFGLSVLSVLLIYAFVRPRYGSLAATLASLIFYAVPVITWLSGTALSDLGIAYFTLFAVISWLRWVEREERRWLVMTALGTGLAMGAKLTGLFTLALLAAAVLYLDWRKRRAFREIAINVGLLSMIALALALPWYLKSYIQTGNPIFPFGYSVFGGRYWTPKVDRLYLAAQFGFLGIGRSLLDYVLLPFRLLIPNHTPYEGPISAIFLIGAGWGLLQRRHKSATYLAVFAVLNFVLWAVWTTQQVRMLLPVLGALSIVAGIGLADLVQRIKRGPLVVGAIVGLLMVEGAIGFLRERSDIFGEQLAVVLGTESRTDYLQKHLEPADMLSFINENLPAQSGVLAFDEVRSFLSQRSFIWGGPYLQAYVNYAALKTREALLQRLREIGADYLLVKQFPIPAQFKPIEDYLQIVYTSNGYQLYQILDDPSQASRACNRLPNQSFDCLVNLKADVPAGEIVKDSRFTQTFLSDCSGLNEIEVYLATYARTNTSSLGFRLRDSETLQLLAEQYIPATELVDNQWHLFKFESQLASKGKHYQITLLSPDAQPGNAVSVWQSNTDVYPDGEAAVNHKPVNGDWAVRYHCAK
jgi:4-amino-4-deoxy-L-arabinose transferase-like glycosyltransferase